MKEVKVNEKTLQTILSLFLEDTLKVIEKIVDSEVPEKSAIMTKRRLEMYLELNQSINSTADVITYQKLISSQGYDNHFIDEYCKKIELEKTYFNKV